MANKPNGTIYIGITNEIEERVKEHKLKMFPRSFTAKYNCDKLIYFEEFSDIEQAILREKQLKNWHKAWKLNLVKTVNPTLKTLDY